MCFAYQCQVWIFLLMPLSLLMTTVFLLIALFINSCFHSISDNCSYHHVQPNVVHRWHTNWIHFENDTRFYLVTAWSRGPVAHWLRYCATKQKVAGSIPGGVMEIFIDINPSDRTMVLGSTQTLTEMGTRKIFLGIKCGRCVRLTTLPKFCAVVKKSGNLNFLEPSGPLQTCNGTALLLFTYLLHGAGSFLKS
jgi:hypothetical protein